VEVEVDWGYSGGKDDNDDGTMGFVCEEATEMLVPEELDRASGAKGNVEGVRTGEADGEAVTDRVPTVRPPPVMPLALIAGE
jgi:hypothetical protein